MIYIDSDTVWLEDPHVLWRRFWTMPAEATIGIVAENIDPGTAWNLLGENACTPEFRLQSLILPQAV